MTSLSQKCNLKDKLLVFTLMSPTYYSVEIVLKKPNAHIGNKLKSLENVKYRILKLCDEVCIHYSNYGGKSVFHFPYEIGTTR